MNTLKEGNTEFLEQLKKTRAQREYHLEIQKKNYALNELEKKKQMSILWLEFSARSRNSCIFSRGMNTNFTKKRRGQQHEQEATPSSTSFGKYFNNFGGYGGNLSEY